MLFLLSPLCSGLLAWLLSRHLPFAGGGTALVVLAGLIFGFASALFLRIVLAVCNVGQPRDDGSSIGRAASDGALVLLPFTVLALLAELLLGWNATQAFASAAIMASSAAIGASAGRLGGRRWASSIGLSLAGVLLSASWMVFCALVALGAGR